MVVGWLVCMERERPLIWLRNAIDRIITGAGNGVDELQEVKTEIDFYQSEVLSKQAAAYQEMNATYQYRAALVGSQMEITRLR